MSVDSFFRKYFKSTTVMTPSIMLKRNRCSIAIAGMAMDRGYGAYSGMPSGPEAMIG